MKYSQEAVVRYFTRLAMTLQRIYEVKYTVHPLHRTLVAQKVLDELCGVNYTEDDDDHEVVPRPLFHPRAPKLSLDDTNLFFAQFDRFRYAVVLGDYHYSFHRSNVLEYDYGDEEMNNILRDESMHHRWNVLENHGSNFLFKYQDEDHVHTVSIQKRKPRNDPSLYLLGTGQDDKFKSLAHYFVVGGRSNMLESKTKNSMPTSCSRSSLDDEEDGEEEEEIKSPWPCAQPEEMVQRLHWLWQRRLIDISKSNWKALLDSVGKTEDDFVMDDNPAKVKKKKPKLKLRIKLSRTT